MPFVKSLESKIEDNPLITERNHILSDLKSELDKSLLEIDEHNDNNDFNSELAKNILKKTINESYDIVFHRINEKYDEIEYLKNILDDPGNTTLESSDNFELSQHLSSLSLSFDLDEEIYQIGNVEPYILSNSPPPVSRVDDKIYEILAINPKKSSKKRI